MNNYNFGYIPNPEHVEYFCAQLSKMGHEPDGKLIANKQFSQTEEKDIVLTEYLQRGFPGIIPYDQQMGSCVTFGGCVCLNTLMAVQIYLEGRNEEIKAPVAEEIGYGLGRVNIFGRNRPLNQDGMNASEWSAGLLKYGTLFKLQYLNNKYDFTTFSGTKCRQFGSTGVPKDLLPLCAEHLAKTSTRITDFDTAAKFISEGFCVHNSSMSNPTASKRDKDGFSINAPGYAHSMAYVGVRYGKRPGLLNINFGWPDSVTGPMWPDTMSEPLKGCSWWVDAKVVDRILKEGDCFTYAGFSGFVAQNLPSYGTENYL
jgi:hypothetical protein